MYSTRMKPSLCIRPIEDQFEVLVGEEFGEGGDRCRFVVINANFEPHVDCGVHRVPRGLDTRGNPAFTGVSYY